MPDASIAGAGRALVSPLTVVAVILVEAVK
jgi:hypothetical protein